MSAPPLAPVSSRSTAARDSHLTAGYAGPVHRSRFVWLLVAAWSVPAALTTLSNYVYDIPGQFGNPLLRALLWEGLPWGLWVAATPVILARAVVPATRRRRWIAGQVAGALAIGVAFGALCGVSGYFLGVRPGRLLGASVRMAIIDWLPLQPVVYAGVLATGIAIDAGRRRRAAELGRAQLETRLAYAQLSALRAQLQPHFLFNTLNAAVALARAGDAEGTARVLVLLGDLLRQLLRSDAPQEVPLSEELALLETYLEIQRVRLGDRLQVGWDIADDVREALVPQLVLQPLVENALQHGIARRTRAGRLDITAARHGDQLRLTVCDDGPGIAPSFSLDVATGVGLRNTRERLQRLNGARSELGLVTRGERTTAAIELPLRTAEVAEDRDG
jgi:two-component system LytT family sensor kinase